MVKKLLIAIWFSIGFFGLNAQTTFNGGGGDNNWNTPANWSAGIPTALDDVIIADGVTVDINVDGQCASFTFADNASTTTVNINTGITLTVSGDINFGNPSVDGANQYLNVDDGNLVAANIYWVNTGSNNQDAQIWLSDGTITVSGDIIAGAGNGQRNYIDCSPSGVNGTGTITVSGDFYASNNTNFFDRGNSTVIYNGAGSQIVANFYYYNLTINGNGNKSLRGNTAVSGSGTITFTNGVLDLNGYYLYFDRNYSIAGSYSSTSMIDLQNGGYVRIRSNSADDLEGIFPIGYGSEYNPLVISNVANDVGGYLGIYLNDVKHPLTSGTDNTLTKYISFVSSDLVGTEFDATFTYSDGDIPGIEGDLDETGYLTAFGWITSTTNPANLGYNHGTNTITLTDITEWGDLILGESSGCFDGTLPDKYTVATGNWNTGSIWNGGTVPATGDNVAILHAVTLNTTATVGNLEVFKAGNLYLNNQDITVQGTTDVYGILRDINGTNGLSRAFQDKITIYTGGEFYCTVDNRTFTFEGGIENNGRFEITNGNGMSINFNTTSQIISGSESPIIDGTITIASGLTLTNQVSEATNGLIIEGTINGADGTASLVNETIISFQGNAISFGTAGVFDAYTTAGNTVKYNSSTNGTQYIAATTYQNIELQDGNGNNNSDKYLSGDILVNGNFTIEDETDFYPESYNLTVTGIATIKDRIYDRNVNGTCTFNGNAFIDGARFDGSANGNVTFTGTLTALTNGFTIDRCNFTLNPDLTVSSGVTILIIDANGTKILGDVTVESGGVWSNTGNSAITVSGDLTINSGATFTPGTGIYTFDGTSKSIGGTISDIDFQNMIIDGTITNNITDIDVIGDITLNSGSLINNGDIDVGDDLIGSGGSVINSNIFEANDFVITNPSVVTNNGTATVLATISGTGSLIQGANSTLYIGGNATITTFDATANPNTVEYNGNGNQTINGGTYHHLIVRDGDSNNSNKTLGGNVTTNGDFTIITSTYFDPMGYDFTVSGSSTIAGVFDDDDAGGTNNLQDVDLSGGSINGGATGIVNILGNLTLPTSDASVGRVDLTVSGTTTISAARSLSFLTSALGTKVFSDDVTVNGSWINTINESFTLSGNLTVNAGATFTQGTGTYTFDGTVKQINGTISDIDFQNIIIDGTITNNVADIDVAFDITVNSGSFTNEGNISLGDDIIVNAGSYINNSTTTVIDDITGAGTLTQGTNSTLYIGGDATITTFDATANPNTVDYNGNGDQTVNSGTYHHLIVRDGDSNNSSKTLGGNVTTNGDFTVIASTYFDPMANDFTVNGSSSIAGVFDDDATGGTNNLQDVDLSGGSITGGAIGIVNILGDLAMPTGDGTIGQATVTVSGTTTVAAGNTLTISSANGTKSFFDDVIISGNWTNSGNESFTISGNFTVDAAATFTQGTGTYTFDGTSKELNGTTAGIDFQNLIIYGSITNNIADIDVAGDITINAGSLTNEGDISAVDDIIINVGTFINNNTTYVGDDISGAGTFVQGSNSYLTIVDDAVLAAFSSSANGNTVEYYSTGGTNIRGNTYHNLIISQVGGATRYLDNSENTITINGDLTISDDAILRFQQFISQTLNVLGNVSGTGTVYFDVRNNAHNLNLSGANNSIGGFTVNGANNFTVDYNGTNQQVISLNNYDLLTISGSGTKTMQGGVTVNDVVSISAGTLDLNSNTLTTSASVNIASGATLEVDESAQLLIANTQTLTNNGTLSVVGTTGNEAIVTINGAGNYNISQPTAGAEINAQYYQFNYLNDGIVITDGSINATNNFSNGSFSDGTGSQYINTTGIDVSGIGNISNVVFNSGPTYNITRTSGTGSMAFEDASGALSGENYDNDNGNPGTLINWSYPGSTYYSNPLGTFSAGTLTDWARNPDGSGGSPVSLSDGLATLIVQDGHTVTVDNTGGDIDILALQVGEGVSGIFRIGEDATQRTVTIQDKIEVQAGGLINVVSSGSPSHLLIIYGNLKNDGTINLRTTSANVANTEFFGASTLISGSTAPIFNDVTFKSGSSITASVSIDVDNNIILEDNSIFQDGGLNHYIGNNWTADGTASMTGTGTIVFNGLVNTIEDGTATLFKFNNVQFNGGTAGSIQENIIVTNNFEVDNSTTVSIANYSVNVGGDFIVNSGSTYSHTANTTTLDGIVTQALDLSGSVTFYNLIFSNGGTNAKSVNGNILASNRVTINSGSTVDGAGMHTIAGGLLIDGTCNFSGIVSLTGNLLFTNDASNTITLGTAQLNINGNVSLAYAGSATALQLNMLNDVNIGGGNLTLITNTSIIGQVGNSFNLTAGRVLFLRDTDQFPSGFGTYSLDITSRVDYEGTNQIVKGNIIYGILRLEVGGTKTVNGVLDIDGQLQLYDNVIFDLQNFNHTFASDITNEAGGCTILGSSANVTLDAPNTNQTVQAGTYSFNDLNIPLSAGTGIVTKAFSSGSTISLNGDFNITNTLGSPSIFLIVDFNDNGISGTPNDFNLGSYCQFNTSNVTFDVSAMNNFGGTITIDPTTYFYYELNGAQNIAGGFTYGHLVFNGGDKTATEALDINGNIDRWAGTPVFYDGGFTHTIQGDWLLNNTAYYTQASATGIIIFDGTDHDIQGYNFNNIIFSNSGTATIQNDLNVYGDLTVNNGTTLDAGIRDIDIGGDWLINATGLFTQDNSADVTFNGATNQSLTSNANSYFGDLIVNKPNGAGNQTVTVLSELHVNDDFSITADAGVLDISNQNAYFSGNFYIYNNTVEAGSPFISTNSTVTFNGTDAQYIKNWDLSDLVFNNVVFTGAGDKEIDYENSIPSSRIYDINGDFTINSSTVDGVGFGDGGVDFNVAGNWSNTGTFIHTAARTVTFDGGNQNISSSNFGSVVFSGTDTKDLLGNITLNGGLTIEAGVTLDANNNNVTLAGDWDNDAVGSVYTPGTGTVTFEGNTADIFAGTGVGKSFYNLIANKNAGQIADMETDVQIDNDLTISSGYLRTQTFDISVGGNFVVSGGIFSHNNNASRLTLNATSGSKTFDPGSSGTTFRGVTINASGVTYTVLNDFTISQNQNFILTDGYFDLNGNTMNVNSTNQIIEVNGGTFDVDEGASINFNGNNQQLLIAGGTFRLVGTSGSNATLTRSGGNGYTVTQTSGTFHAQHYRVESGNGITISGGTIDGTDNFSNGTFTNGGSNAYLTLTGLNFTDYSATNVLFNTGPTYNVSRTSGTGIITFEDSFGSLAGEAYDEDDADPGTLILWTFPTGFFWDAGDLTDNEDWNRGDNWSGNMVPTNANNVILNHDFVAGAYNVKITAANADAYRLTMDDQSTGNGITLLLENGFDLNVDENINVGTNTTLTQTDNTNTITIGQNYVNDGTLNNGNSTITFDGPAGTYTISPGGSGAGKSFYNFIINATDATYNLSDVLDVDNNLTVTDGNFDLGSSVNDITVGGDWTIDLVNGATFTHNNADVTLDGNDQNIDGGTFYNLITATGGTKTLLTNIDVDNDIVIGTLTTLDAQGNSIYVGDDWTNNGGFTQTGLGNVTFDGTGGQNIDNGSVATDFNYLIFSNGGAKTFYNSSNVNADLTINNGSGVVDVNTFTVTGVGASNTLTSDETLYIRGTNNFPSGFETISLASNSWVDYLGTIDQTIYSTTYGNLRLRSSGATTTKTAAGDLILLGQLDMDNDALTTLDMLTNSANMTIAGNITVVGDDINWGTGTSTLIHNGGAGWVIDADIATFNNVILAGAGNVWMRGDLTVTGDFTVQNGVYLRMYINNDRSQPHTMTGAAGKTFTLENGARCYSPIDDGTGPAIPTNFGTYDIKDNSNYYLFSPDGVNQILYTDNSIEYGNLYFNGIKNVTSDGVAVLDVDGIFDIYNATYFDNGQNMNFAGSNIYITNYTPSASTITVTLDGNINQQISDDANNQIDVGTLVCAGSATKTLCDGNDVLNITGDFTINSGVDVTSSEIINFSGTNWTNNGTFSHTAQTVTFNGTGNQNIDPGASNFFNDVYFDNSNTVTFINNGIDVNDDFTINTGTVDLGALSHVIADDLTNTTGGTLTSNLADLTFDGGGQLINTPAFSAANVTISGTGTKYMFSDWTITGDISINAGSGLNTSDLAIPTYYDLYIGGNWTNNGTFTDNTSTVTFNGSSSPINIASGGSNFYNVDFNPGAAVTYNLTSTSTRIARTMDVQTNATLNLNSNTLILGSNRGDGKTYTINGTLMVNENASLLFNNQNSQSIVNVSGTLQAVGTDASNVATISREVAGVAGSETQINILSGGTLAAQYYLIEYLQDAGLIMQTGSILDATNNLSNGIWSNIRTVSGVSYIDMECNYAGGVIDNITFNYSGTPTQGNHFNVRRNSAATPITFDNVLGNLGSFLYEDDDEVTPAYLTGLLRWPAPTETNWTGAVNSDWHTAGNWDNGVPSATVDAIIPNRTNDPVISNADAECDALTITDGNLRIESDRKLDANGDVTIGTSTNVGLLTVITSNSIIEVGGSWTRGTNGIFTHGDGTVVFNSGSGSATILPLTSDFYKVQFDNASSTFTLSGSIINFDGDFEILNGIVNPGTNGYTYNIQGDFNNSGGTFNPTVGGVTNGTVVFNGTSDQNITGGVFSNLTIDGSANKITNGITTIENTTTINSTLTVNTGSNIDFNGNVTIDAGGTFNDGNETHTFTGQNWTGDGSYAGSGTIEFDRTANDQFIYGGTFYNLDLNSSTESVNLMGDVTINNDLTVRTGVIDLDLDTYQITNSSGTGTFTMEDGTYLYVSGANNFPASFGTYSLNSTTRVYYDGTMDQSVASVTYGSLFLDNANTKSLTGDIIIQDDLYFYNDVTLDATSNNYNIEIGDNWDNDQSAGVFLPNGGEVEFNGNDANQNIYIGVLASNEFYDLTVNNSGGGDINFNSNVTYTINNNIHVTNGRLDGAGRTIYVGGDLLASGGGTFAANSTYILNSSGSGSHLVGTNGSTLFNLTIDSPGGATYIAQDDISLNGDFYLDAGTFNGNSNDISLGNGNTDIVSIIGTYQIGAGGTLGIGNGTSLTVDAAGSIEAVGNSSNIVTISNNASGGRYNFTVNGTIAAEYYLFEYMSSTGIYLSNSSTIDATNHFSNGTFTRGANSGQLFRIENTQSFTGNDSIYDVSFPVNPGGSAANVTKNAAASGTLEFYNATGAFSGETYDQDPNNLIDWTGPVTLTWVGTVSTNWNDVGNWSASSGPDMVPTGAEDVIIAPAVNQPILTTFGATTANLTIQSGASITFNTPDDAAAVDLDVDGDLNIDGTLWLISSNDYLTVEGNWTKTGTVTMNGNVTFDGSGGSKSINNGNTAFYNLIISGTSTYQLARNTIVSNNFTINTGAHLDVTATDYDLTINGNWTNNGTFSAQDGLVTFSATSGTKTISAGSSAFNDVEINTSAATYRLTEDMSVDGNFDLIDGTFEFNNQTLNMGDGSGSDYFTVTGTATIDENATLAFGANAIINVNSGGTINIVGADAANIATVTRQSTGAYSFDINSGATINAQYYLFEYMDADGIYVHNGATVGSSNDFSDGTFANGFATGTSLKLEHDVAIGEYIDNVVFNSGSLYNVTRTTGANEIFFSDASGPLGTYEYELDDLGTPDAGNGLLRWSYINTNIWDGDQADNDWHNPDNWSGGTVPDLTKNAIIPNVTYDPIISANAQAKRLSLETGATLTINADFEVAEEFYYQGSAIATGSPNITVGDNWSSSSGSFTAGNSTVILNSVSGTKDITIGSDSFYNLQINTGGTYQLAGNIEVTNNLTITSGTLNSNIYDITVGGNWSNSGSFTEGLNAVTVNGSTGTFDIDNGSSSFYDLTINSGNGTGDATFRLQSNLNISDDLTVTKGTLDLSPDGGTSSYNISIGDRMTNTGGNLLGRGGVIQVGENWLVTGSGVFTCGNSTVELTSDAGTRTVDPGSSNFYNLTLSGIAIFRLSENTIVENDLNIASGTLDMSSSPSYNLTVSGNWTNTGSFNERLSTVTLNGTDQTLINATGEVFYSVIINNTSLTLTSGDMDVTNTLNMTSGNILAGANRLTLGTSTANPGTFTYTSGTIIGEFERWLNALGTDYIFPVGTAANNNTATLRFLAGLTSGSLVVEFVASDPGITGLPIDDAGYIVNNVFPDGYWNVTSQNSLACTDYNLTLDGTGFNSIFTIDSETRIIKRTSGGNWDITNAGSHTAAVPPFVYRTGINGISSSTTQFGLGLRDCTGGTIDHGDTEICDGDDADAFTNTESPSGGTGYTYTWQYTTNLSAVPGDSNWTDIASSNSLTYDPSILTETTRFVRKAEAASGCVGAQYSNVITINVNPKPSTGGVNFPVNF